MAKLLRYSTKQVKPAVEVSAIVLSVCLSACLVSYRLSIIGISAFKTNEATVLFVKDYMRGQAAAFRLDDQYDERLSPNGGSTRWAALASEYAAVLDRDYACQFELSAARFSLRCGLNRPSASALSFYGDQTGIIRSSITGPAGPSSPAMKLDPQLESEFHDAFRGAVKTEDKRFEGRR